MPLYSYTLLIDSQAIRSFLGESIFTQPKAVEAIIRLSRQLIEMVSNEITRKKASFHENDDGILVQRVVVSQSWRSHNIVNHRRVRLELDRCVRYVVLNLNTSQIISKSRSIELLRKRVNGAGKKYSLKVEQETFFLL